jgi:hypothetical protein
MRARDGRANFPASHRLAQSWTDQRAEIGDPAASGTVSLGVGSVAGAGSFPRSFLIPGTDTSIRIGGS